MIGVGCTMLLMLITSLTVAAQGFHEHDLDSIEIAGDPFYIRTPTDVEALLGQNVTLHCQVVNITLGANYVIWRRLQPVQEVIFVMGSKFGHNITDRYSLVGSAVTGEYHFHIRNLRKEDSGTYECAVARSSLRAVATISALVVPGAPVITTNLTTPTSRSGQVVQITCTSSGGFPSPKITWSRNGSPVNNVQHVTSGVQYGSASSMVAISLQASDNEGRVQCSVMNKVLLKPLTAPLLVDVQYAPVVSISQSSPYTVLEGDRPVSLSCAVDANPSHNSITWYKNNVLIDDEVSAELKFEAVNRDQTGNYTCLASNSLGSGSDSIQLVVYYAPVVTAPALLEVREATEFSVQCDVDALPAVDSVTWRWSDSSRQLLSADPYVTLKHGVLRVQLAHRRHSGILVCEATNYMTLSGSNTPVQKTGQALININVLYGPGKAEILPPLLAVVGEKLSLTCVAEELGNPTAHMVWTRDSTVLSNSSTLQLREVRLEDEGVYRCRAENSVSAGPEDQITLSVIERPVWQTPTLAAVQVIRIDRSSPLALACSVRAKPRPQVRWYKNGREITHDNARYTVTSHWQKLTQGNYITNSELKFVGIDSTHYVNKSDKGNYTCEVYSHEGLYTSTSTTQQLLVQYAPVAESLKTVIAADIGSEAVLSCMATSFPRSNITWYRSTQSSSPITSTAKSLIQESVEEADVLISSLTLNQVKESDRSVYYCVASNGLGSHSAFIHLRPAGAPEQPRDLRLTQSTRSVTWGSVQLTWRAGFDGGSRQTYVISGSSVHRNFSVTSENSTGNVTGLRPRTSYSFRVKSVNQFGESDWSNYFSIDTQGLDLPSILDATFNSDEGTVEFPPQPSGLCIRIEARTRSQWLIDQSCAPAASGMSSISVADADDVRLSVCLTSRSDICGVSTVAARVKSDISTGTVVAISCVCVIIVLALFVVFIIVCYKKRRFDSKEKLRNKDCISESRDPPPIVPSADMQLTDTIDMDDPTLGGLYALPNKGVRQIGAVLPTRLHNPTYAGLYSYNEKTSRLGSSGENRNTGICRSDSDCKPPPVPSKLDLNDSSTVMTSHSSGDPSLERLTSLGSTESGYNSHGSDVHKHPTERSNSTSHSNDAAKRVFYEVVV